MKKTKAPVIDILTRKPLVIVKARKSAKVKKSEETRFAEAVCKYGSKIAKPRKFSEPSGTYLHMLFAVFESESGKDYCKILNNEDFLYAKSHGSCDFYKVYFGQWEKIKRALAA